MQAVTSYLSGLQSARGLNDAEVAAELKKLLGRDVASTTVWRAVSGRSNSRLDVILGILVVLGANPAEVLHLFTSNTDPGDAERLGRRAATGDVNEDMIRETWRRVPQGRRAAARQRIIDEINS